MRKKEQNKKNETEKRSQDQVEVHQKDARIRGSKEWSREKISGSGGCCGKKDFRIRGQKNGAEKRFQDQAVDAQKE
jgi:hypothetical protein